MQSTKSNINAIQTSWFAKRRSSLQNETFSVRKFTFLLEKISDGTSRARLSIILSALLAAFSATAESTTTAADPDGSCQLLSASCNEDGFKITFDMTCRNDDYKAVKWEELYAFPTLSPDHHVWGTTCMESHDAECCFADVNGDGTLIRMNFNFKQCGTTHDDDFVDPNSLKYYNRIQGQEYYNDILLGVG